MKAVIFDMDGVVQDTESIHQNAEFEVLNRHGAIPDPSDWNDFHGRKAIEIFEMIIERYHLTGVTAEQLMQEKREIYFMKAKDEARLMPGFSELLKFLSPNYRLGLVTSSVKETQEFAFELFKLDGLFETVVNADMVSKSKPDPEPYSFAIGKMGLEPSECAVIEDAENGLMSAKAAGAHTIGLTSTMPAGMLKHADLICTSHAEIKALFEKGWPF